MERFIHRDKRFEEALAAMRAKGGRTAAIADKAEEIIAAIRANPHLDPLSVPKITGNGENRIDDCGKFNLGSGYRLVFLNKGRHIVFLYIGTHDDCFRWINRNRDLRYELKEQIVETPTVAGPSPPDEGLPPDVIEEREFVREYEERFMKSLDERILRKVFSEWFVPPVGKPRPAGQMIDGRRT